MPSEGEFEQSLAMFARTVMVEDFVDGDVIALRKFNSGVFERFNIAGGGMSTEPEAA